MSAHRASGRGLAFLALWTGGLSAGCAPDSQAVHLPVEHVGAVLLARVGGAGISALEAVDVDPGQDEYLGVPSPQPGEALYALELRCTLGQLGLAQGPLTPTSAEPPSASRVPPPRRVRRLDGEAWTELSSAPEPLAELRLSQAPPDRCVRFEAQVHELGIDLESIAVAILDLDGTGKVAVLRDGRVLHVVGPEEVTLLTRAPAGVVAGAAVDHNPGPSAPARLYLVYGDGQVQRSDLQRGWEALPAAPVRTSRAQLAVSNDGRELFLLDDHGRLLGLMGSVWAELRPASMMLEENTGMLWMGSMDVLFVLSSERTALRWHDGRLEAVDFGLPLGGGNAYSLSMVSGVGPAIGTNLGAVYWQYQGEWRSIADPETRGESVAQVLAVDRGLLYGGRKGVLAQHHPAFGECPLTAYSADPLAFGSGLGDGFVFYSTSPGEQDLLRRLLFLRRTSPPLADCARWEGEELGL